MRNSNFQQHYENAVADTFWSVHIKCCSHKKKIKTQASNDKPKPDQRQRKDCNQSSTKNVTDKISRFLQNDQSFK